MAELTTRGRKGIKTSNFAIPGKRAYPIHDKAHAANALARVAQHGSSAEKSKVRAAVDKKYPGLRKKNNPDHMSQKEYENWRKKK